MRGSRPLGLVHLMPTPTCGTRTWESGSTTMRGSDARSRRGSSTRGDPLWPGMRGRCTTGEAAMPQALVRGHRVRRARDALARRRPPSIARAGGRTDRCSSRSTSTSATPHTPPETGTPRGRGQTTRRRCRGTSARFARHRVLGYDVVGGQCALRRSRVTDRDRCGQRGVRAPHARRPCSMSRRTRQVGTLVLTAVAIAYLVWKVDLGNGARRSRGHQPRMVRARRRGSWSSRSRARICGGAGCSLPMRSTSACRG
jgi:hypothetical protein